MKIPTTGTNKSSKQPAVGLSHNRVYRRNLALRGDEQQREDKWQLPGPAVTMAEQLQMLEQYIAKVPVVDFHRRNMIRNAIATGAYTIDPMSIASKFLKFEEDLYS